MAAERCELALLDAEDVLDQARYEGKQQGETGLLQRQLIRKFGPLSQDLQHRIQWGTPEQLEPWSLNILDANTLDEVFLS
ncbi:DUF4351 domain-containing protein [Paenalcaligenes niemegkensis]|uniref:DUF4351 domain-containing protein n=1 Tax=Paenalcaligenes niemegkensis TaxID=2895469 RepID=UPI001EE781C9|nr:DUF4351 domain-containing protein [Paenalcaligenes niemegkensis]MCQ9616141.1 DUF4351 domain-containing protein [Paenalcaligenes niemegkensis]